jgi:hypothetical protein
MTKFWVKAQNVDQHSHMEHMVNVCDEKIIGKEFGPTKIYESFFKGELMDEEKMLSKLQDATIGDLFGNDCVKSAIKAGFISEKNVKEVHGVKHAIIIGDI